MHCFGPSLSAFRENWQPHFEPLRSRHSSLLIAARAIKELVIRQLFGVPLYFHDRVDLQWRSREGPYQIGISARSCIIPKNEEICIWFGRSAVPLPDSQSKHAVFMLWLTTLLMLHLCIGSFQCHLPQYNFEPDSHREKWFLHRYSQLSLQSRLLSRYPICSVTYWRLAVQGSTNLEFIIVCSMSTRMASLFCRVGALLASSWMETRIIMELRVSKLLGRCTTRH